MAVGERSCGIIPLTRRSDDCWDVLFVQHASTGEKGRIEVGETALQTAVRELREETNLVIAGAENLLLDGKSFTSRYLNPVTHLIKEVKLFVAEIAQPNIIKYPPDEIQDTLWVKLSLADEQTSWKEDREALAWVRHGLSDQGHIAMRL